jgi:subtilisin family serine protease
MLGEERVRLVRFPIQAGAVVALSVAASVLVVGSPAFAKDVAVPNGEKANGRYVVVFKDSVAAGKVAGVADSLTKVAGATKTHVYASALKGFSVKATPAQARRLAKDSRVDVVYQDGYARPAVETSPDAVTNRAPCGDSTGSTSALPLNKAYRYNVTPTGVHAYVIDTGIRTTHTQFGGRASVGADFVGDGRNGQDCNGHGTHVAGTIGGSTFGVAKGVSLVAVRVFGCSGGALFSTIIAGVDWVTAHAVKPAVVNMSLGGSGYLPLDLAVHRSIESGITYAVSAGNASADACYTSPARTLSAITVAATGNYGSTNPVSDGRASFSNYGSCVDLFAPGVGVTSSWYTSTTATNTISGTSMASPHVAGVAALYLSVYPTANPMTVRNALSAIATKGVVTGAGTGSPNALLYAYLRPETAITLDATPEPVKAGGTVVLRGKLTRDGAVFAGQTVSLYFTPVGGAAVLRSSAVTTSSGSYVRSLVQSVSGTWTARYSTNGAIIGSAAADAVNVY